LIITPIEKKYTNNKNPEDFRPISVSTVFSNIYEMIILKKIKYLNLMISNLAINLIHHASMHLSSLMKPYHITRREKVRALLLVLIWKKRLIECGGGLLYKLKDKIEV
jgi:hypothetical protein